MSKIATYSLADSPLQLSDRLIGTEAPRPTPSATPLATKNFSLGELLQLFSVNFPSSTLQAVLNTGNTATQNINLTGTINVDLIKPTNIEDMLGSIGTPLQVLSKGVGGICWIDIALGTEWGTITGDIENQTDLINYISSQITIPTLQEVTDNGGNTTSNTIQVGGITSGNFSSDGFGVYISDSYDTTYNFNYIPFVGLQIGDGLSQYVTLGNDGRIEFVNSAGGVGVLRSNLLTGYVEWELPDAFGTIALTSDIPTLIEGSGIDIDYTDPLNIIISATGGGGGSPTGPAGGDLSATYPNPSVVWNNGKSTYDLVYYPLTSNPAGYLTAAAAALTYYPIPTGTISQYIRGDGSLATFPSATIPTLQQVVTAGPTITTAFTHASTSFENTFNAAGIAINNFINNSNISYQGNGIFHAKGGLQQSLVFGPFDGLTPASREITIPNADGTIALTSDIQTLVEGKNINIVSDEIEVAIPPIALPTSTILGTTGNFPQSITIDSSGNVYTVNLGSTNVTKITPSGVSSTLGSTGSAPQSITIDSLGNVYTANLLSDNVTKITPSGVSSTLGTTGSLPVGITIDSLGNVYTANQGSDNVTKITPSGVSSTLGSTGIDPHGIVLDSSGNIYTSNKGSDNVTKITPSGTSSTFGSTGSTPVGITIDSLGNVYTANLLSDNVTKIAPSGTSSTLGTTGDEPIDITIDSLGNVYTVNRNSSTVTKITPSGTSSTLASTGFTPVGITIDSSGNIYTVNRNSDNVSKITSDNARILAVDDNLNIIRVDGSGSGSSGVTSVTATSPITSSGGATPDISTSMNTNKLIGRSTAGVGVMEEITIGSGLALSGGTLSSSATGGGIAHATAAGTDTYTATITGVTAYNDADAYLIRFTNGNTTGATLNINGLGARPLYRNNDGVLIGGDIISGGEMLCVYNSTTSRFQVIGTAPNSLFSYVTNDDSVTLTKGMPVYAFSGQGDRMTVKRANNLTDATSAQTVGLVLSTSIAAGQRGLIMMQGLLDGLSILPTATWNDGDAVYLGATDGSITNIKPFAPNHLVYLGVVTTASNGAAGRMYVRVQNGFELQELHNVQAQSPSLNDTLWYDNTVSPAQWKTASIPTILGFTPEDVANKQTDLTASATKYPTVNAVNTGLALKQNILSYTPYKNVQTSQTVHTGTTLETNIFTATIPAGAFNANDVIKLLFSINKPTSLAGYNLRLRLSTTNTPLTGTLIGTFNQGGTNLQSAIMTRNFSLNGGNLYGVSFPTTIITDQIATNVLSSTPLNPANQFFIHANIILVNVGDSIIGTMLSIHN